MVNFVCVYLTRTNIRMKVALLDLMNFALISAILKGIGESLDEFQSRKLVLRHRSEK